MIARYMFRMMNALFYAFIMHESLPHIRDKGLVARPGSKFDLVPEKSVPPRRHKKTHDALDLAIAGGWPGKSGRMTGASYLS